MVAKSMKKPFNNLAELLNAIGVKTKRQAKPMNNLDRVLAGKKVRPIKDVKHCGKCGEVAHQIPEECHKFK